MEVKRIAKEHVLKISSGQVIVSLASATKELIENAMDAGASSIEIIIHNSGVDCVEVRDNGKGIPSEHYNNVAKRYTTSKLETVEDLHRVQSYGFRGEALNSICSVAKVTAITRTSSDDTATEITFDEQGRVTSQKPVAGGVGTTIKVSELFHSLAVRRKDLVMNSNREYTKLLNLTQAYAMICSQTSFTIAHIDKKHVRTKVLYTPGKGELGDSLQSIFGKRFMTLLEKFDAKLHDTRDVSVSGYVSKNSPNACKPTGSQQFSFLNGRPVDLPKLVRVMNEAYRTMDPTVQRNGACPIFVLDFTIPMDMVDVNMAPDKRTVLFTDQDRIFKALQSRLCAQLDPSAQRSFNLQIGPSVEFADSQSTQSLISDPSKPLTVIQMEEMERTEKVKIRRDEAEEGNSALLKSSTMDEESRVYDIEVGAVAEKRERDTQISGVPTSSHMEVDETEPQQIDSERNNKQEAKRKHAEEEEEEEPLEMFEPKPKKFAPLQVNTTSSDPLTAPEVIDIDLPTPSQVEKKKSSLDSIMERYNRPASSPTPRSSIISLLDNFSASSTVETPKNLFSSQTTPQAQEQIQIEIAPRKMQPSPSIASDQFHDEIEDAYKATSPLQVRDQPKGEPKLEKQKTLEIQIEEDQDGGKGDKHSHNDHHNCCNHEEHLKSHTEVDSDDESIDLDEKLPTTDSHRMNLTEVEYDAPVTNSSRIPAVSYLSASQALGQVSNKIPFKMSSFAARYRSRCARLESQAIEKRDFRERLKDLSSDAEWKKNQKPKRIGSRTVRKFSPIATHDRKTIAATSAEQKARNEMTKQVSKQDFLKMIVIGQFNKSFIIAKLDDELFILDQHACDEKYTFEQLCKTKALKIQPMIHPIRLELPPPDVDIVLTNLDEFTSRGFLIELVPDTGSNVQNANQETFNDAERNADSLEMEEEQKVPQFTRSKGSKGSFLSVERAEGETDWRDNSSIHRLQLVGHVLKKGNSDLNNQVQEIIEALRDGVCDIRLESEYKANASEACRKSVMFGSALSAAQLKSIVTNMSTMTQPWNCPHGRPTMRHLMSLNSNSGIFK